MNATHKHTLECGYTFTQCLHCAMFVTETGDPDPVMYGVRTYMRLCSIPGDERCKHERAKIESERNKALEEAAQIIDKEIVLRERFDYHMEPIEKLAQQIRDLKD